jgi:DNA-directed RNA polymerase subunit RPC12/RpoP
MKPPRIYADYNGLQASPRNLSKLAVALDTFGSLRDLSNAGIRLQDGIQLIIFDYSDDEGDLENTVIVYWEKSRNRWLAEFIEEEVVYIPKRDRIENKEFLCLKCRSSLQDHIEINGMNENSACPRCRERIIAAIEAPK